MSHTLSWLIALFLAMNLLACGGSSTTNLGNQGGLVLSVATDKPSYSAGEAIGILFRIVNSTAQAVTVNSSSTQRFDLRIRRDGAVIWQWSADKAFGAAMWEHTYPPNSSETISEVARVDVSPGNYEVIAVLPSFHEDSGREPSMTATAHFQVVK